MSKKIELEKLALAFAQQSIEQLNYDDVKAYTGNSDDADSVYALLPHIRVHLPDVLK